MLRMYLVRAVAVPQELAGAMDKLFLWHRTTYSRDRDAAAPGLHDYVEAGWSRALLQDQQKGPIL